MRHIVGSSQPQTPFFKPLYELTKLRIVAKNAILDKDACRWLTEYYSIHLIPFNNIFTIAIVAMRLIRNKYSQFERAQFPKICLNEGKLYK